MSKKGAQMNKERVKKIITADEVKHLRKKYMESQDIGDVEGCLSYWDDEGALMPPNSEVAQGKKALRALYEDLFGHYDEKNMITFDEIGVSEDWSFAQGCYEGVDIPKDGGEPVPQKGKYLEIHRRQLDGSLKFFRHMWSPDK
jgi:ketosteroid isomerase-like protein